MKRTILGLASVVALAVPATTAHAAQELPVRAYPVWCGYTLVYQCGICVEVGNVTNCTYW